MFAEVDHEYTAYIEFRGGNGRHRIPRRNLHRRSRYEVGWSCRFPIDRRNGWNRWCGRYRSRSIVHLRPLIEWIRRIIRLVIYRLRTIDITRSSIIVPHLLRFGCSQPSLSWIRVPSFDVFFISVPVPISSCSRISKRIGGYTSCCTLVAICESGGQGLVDKVESRVFLFCQTVRIEFSVVACIIAVIGFVVTGSSLPLYRQYSALDM